VVYKFNKIKEGRGDIETTLAQFTGMLTESKMTYMSNHLIAINFELPMPNQHLNSFQSPSNLRNSLQISILSDLNIPQIRQMHPPSPWTMSNRHVAKNT